MKPSAVQGALVSRGLGKLQAQLAADGDGSALQGVQGDPGIFRIEQTVERAAAGLHAGRHSGLGKTILSSPKNIGVHAAPSVFGEPGAR